MHRGRILYGLEPSRLLCVQAKTHEDDVSTGDRLVDAAANIPQLAYPGGKIFSMTERPPRVLLTKTSHKNEITLTRVKEKRSS